MDNNFWGKEIHILFIVSLLTPLDCKILLLVDDNAESWVEAFTQGLADYDVKFKSSPEFEFSVYYNESDWEEVCQVAESGVTMVLDATRKMGEPVTKPQEYFSGSSIPYIKLQMPFDVLLNGMNAMFESNNASNGFLIFKSKLDVHRGIHVILGSTLIRYAFLNTKTQANLIVEKFDYRIPSVVVFIGESEDFNSFVDQNRKIVRDITDWTFLFQSFQLEPPMLKLDFPYLLAFYGADLCCSMSTVMVPESAPCLPEGGMCKIMERSTSIDLVYLRYIGYRMAEALNKVDPKFQTRFTPLCSNDADPSVGSATFEGDLLQALETNSSVYAVTDKTLSFMGSLTLQQVDPTKAEKLVTLIGKYTAKQGFSRNENFLFRKRLPHYRVGIVQYPPWTYKDETGKWAGYCIDLAKEISKKMNFTYDLVESKGFGERVPPSGLWNGLTGDIVHGKVDIAIAAFVMTSEREEFIDFVSPYYEQSGLIIAMQRPVVKNSLFKFMNVLRPEVWLSIAGATVATAIMLWFLDKFSPYSGQNNAHKYKNYRKFTLKESFWFALTSFTPQGGGEPPKALSGRTLVAAYWIFVVLMLATFTANLAAFLTVERMQSPIRNLEHLASQSSVKYSVMANSSSHTFFKNMAGAEEILYQMWRNLTLKAPSSERQYIVWEYPIREMYIHIHNVIEATGFVSNKEEGFQKAQSDPYFAFIHDAAQTKYEVYRNCNLTLIGEPFAEAPYAIAVAQGNPIQDDVSMAILQLQTERHFETLSARYWTSQCPNLSDGESDGISLESLGGVFIATIIGLGIAFISLAFEVFTTARNRRKAQIAETSMIKPQFIAPLDFYGASDKMNQKIAEQSKALKRTHFLPEVVN